MSIGHAVYPLFLLRKQRLQRDRRVHRFLAGEMLDLQPAREVKVMAKLGQC